MRFTRNWATSLVASIITIIITLLVATSAGAALVNPPTVAIPGVTVSGQVQTIAAPADARFGVFESNTTAFLWAEKSNVVLAAPQLVTIVPFQAITPEGPASTNGLGPGSAFYDLDSQKANWEGNLGPGTYNSYFLHMDKDGANQTFVGTINFSQEIVALIFNRFENCNTDPIFGTPGTIYPTSPCGDTRNFDLPGAANWLSLSADRKTLMFSQVVAHDLDQVRIITAVPVPAAFWLFGGALGLLGWLRRKGPA